MNICILDDEKVILDEMNKQIKSIFKNCKNIFLFDNYDDFHKVLISNKIDLLFIDIKLNNKNGVDLVKENNNLLNKTKIVYITGYDYAEKIFETDPYYYLKKPITNEKIKKVYDKLQKDESFITVKLNKEVNRILIKEIIYIESMARMLIFHLSNNQIVETYNTIDSIKKYLPNNFIQIHKSFIVNMDKIKSYKKYEVCLNNDKRLNISRNYANEVQNKIMDYIKIGDLNV